MYVKVDQLSQKNHKLYQETAQTKQNWGSASFDIRINPDSVKKKPSVLFGTTSPLEDGEINFSLHTKLTDSNHCLKSATPLTVLEEFLKD